MCVYLYANIYICVFDNIINIIKCFEKVKQS